MKREGNLLPRTVIATAAYGAGNTIPQIVGFLLLPLYTRLLTPADYGIVELCASIGVVAVVLVRLGLPGSITRFYYDYGETDDLRGHVTTLTVFMLAWGGLFTVLAMAVAQWLVPHVLPGLPVYPFVLLALLGALFGVLPEVQRRLLQVRERARLAATLTAARGSLAVALTLAFVAGFRWGALGMVLASAATALVFSVVAVLTIRGDLGGSIRRAYLPDALKYGLPMIPHHLGGWLLHMANRLVLGGLAGLLEVGVFSVATRFATPLLVLVTAFNTAYTPIYFSLRREEDSDARVARLISTALLVAIWAFVGVATVMPPLLRLVTPPEYHAAAEVVAIIALGAVALAFYNTAASEMFFAKKTHYVAPIGLAGGGVNLLLSLLLVPVAGATGAAIAFLVGVTTTAVLTFLVSRRLHALPVPIARLLCALGAGVLVAVVPGVVAARFPYDLISGVLLWLGFPPALLVLRIVTRSEIAQLRAALRR